MQTPMLPVNQYMNTPMASAFQVKTNGPASTPKWTTTIQITIGQSSPLSQTLGLISAEADSAAGETSVGSTDVASTLAVSGTLFTSVSSSNTGDSRVFDWGVTRCTP